MEEISLYYNYYNTPIYKSQFEKTFANGGYIKIPFQSNKGLTEPNLIITNGNTNIKYKTENLYLFNNIHKIPLISKKNKNKILPENEEDQEVFADGELVIEHISLTNEFQKVYTVFLLSYSAAVEENGSLNKNPIDLLIKSSLSMKKEEEVSSLNSLSLNHLLNIESSAKCISNNERTVFIFKTPILTTSFDFLAETPQEVGVEGSSPELLFPIFKKKDYHNYKVYIQTPQDYGIILPSYTKDHFNIFDGGIAEAKSRKMEESSNFLHLPSRDTEKEISNEFPEKESFAMLVDDTTTGSSPNAVPVNDGDPNNKVLTSTNIKLTDRLQLECSNTGSTEGKLILEPLNILMLLICGTFSIMFFSLVIYKYEQFIKLTENEPNKLGIRSNQFISIFILLCIICFPLTSSWMKEIRYIGYLCFLGVFFTLFVIYNFLKNAEPEIKVIDIIKNTFLKETCGFYIFNIIVSAIVGFVFWVVSISDTFYFTTFVFTNNRYPNDYWLKKPLCNRKEEEKNAQMHCSDLNHSKQAKTNGEISGLHFIPLLILILFKLDLTRNCDPIRDDYKNAGCSFLIFCWTIVEIVLLSLDKDTYKR